MSAAEHARAAKALRTAAACGVFIAPLRETHPHLSEDDAYAIQSINTQQRVADGARIVGRKIGLTSIAVQRQLGVDRPDFGVLFDDMSYGDGEVIGMAGLQQPKVEAEIAFVMGRDLPMDRPGHAEVLNAIDYALPAIEIVGSRIEKWNIGFVDTVADNASAGAFVLGGALKRITNLDMRLCGVVMNRRGEPVSTGAGAACLGHPLNAVVWLARTLARLGTPLRCGDLVLSGALGPMVTVAPGDTFDAHINGVGSVRTTFAATVPA